MGSRRLNSIDEEAKLREKHQGLLQEYLVLQKECVSKKRKLKETNERKESLMDEIRFLKHRRDDFLLKRQSHKAVHHTDNIQLQKREAQYDVESSRRYTGASSSGEAFSNQKPPFNPLRNTGRVVKEEVAFPPVNLAKKPKNMFTNGKQAEKRKISWQDPLALKV